jgi:hypothetical protein
MVSHPINTICINKSLGIFLLHNICIYFFFFNFANIEQWLFLLYPNWFDHGSAPRVGLLALPMTLKLIVFITTSNFFEE